MSDAPIDEPALPRAPVLGYLTQTKTAARARSVTAVFTMLLGLAALAVGLTIFYPTATQIYEQAAEIASWRAWTAGRGPPGPVIPPGRVTLGDVKDAMTEMQDHSSRDDTFPLFIWFPATLTVRFTAIVWMLVPGIALAACSLFVWRGRRWACGAARFFVWPLMTAGVLLATLFVALAIVFGAGRGWEPAAWLWLLAVPPCLLLVLLMHDLCTYQLWIARHPFTDKPRRDFVTGREKAA